MGPTRSLSRRQRACICVMTSRHAPTIHPRTEILGALPSSCWSQPRSATVWSIIYSHFAIHFSFTTIASFTITFNATIPHNTYTMILPYVGISGSGLFAVYLLGVLDTLISNHSIVPGHTVLAGSSGGGMLALHTCLGLHPRHTFVHFNAALQQCAATPHSCALSNLTNMGGRVMQAMISHLNDDQAWKKCVNKAHVHMSLVHNAPHDAAHADCPLQLRKLGWSISNWTSNEDVIHAAGATSYIPGIMGSHCATTFRGQPVIDGGYHDHLPCPPGRCCRFCCMMCVVDGTHNIACAYCTFSCTIHDTPLQVQKVHACASTHSLLRKATWRNSTVWTHCHFPPKTRKSTSTRACVGPTPCPPFLWAHGVPR